MTALPARLQAALDRVIAEGQGDLRAASVRLSERYRAEAGHPSGMPELLAYAATRMPATFAAAARALEALASALPDFAPTGLLDLGAGPGTIGWAAIELFPTIASVRFVERDGGFTDLGRALAVDAASAIAGATWTAADFEAGIATAASADLVTLGYVLSELSAPARTRLTQQAWQKTSGALVLIEPGTPAGTARILAARDWLIAEGAMIAAPCPHGLPCPLASLDPWCHFEARLPRSRLHRQLKGGDLGYEDEKFAYLVAVRAKPSPIAARILFPPRGGKAGIDAQICREDGQAAVLTIPARDKARHRVARRWRWGDGL